MYVFCRIKFYPIYKTKSTKQYTNKISSNCCMIYRCFVNPIEETNGTQKKWNNNIIIRQPIRFEEVRNKRKQKKKSK